MPESTTPLHAGKHGRLIVVSGPSGVGKSTIDQRVVQRTGAVFSVSATTRPPRRGEVDGRDYRFVDEPAFLKMIERDELLEWAEVFGNYYGTPAAPVDENLLAGRDVILEIDVQGGIQVARKRPGATTVLIVPPNDEDLHKRLTGRATDAPDVVERRLAKAKEEIQAARDSGCYQHEVVNDDLDRAVDELVDIIERGEPEA